MARRAKEIFSEYLSALPRHTLPVFTDGSSLVNPGPCGASAVIYTHGLDSEPVILKHPVAIKSSSFHGELDAISLALTYCVNLCARPVQFNAISIFTDCRAALQTVVNGVVSNYTSLVLDIQRSIKSLQEQDISIELIWIPGHADLKPNELADIAAKDAARQAAQLDSAQDNSTLSLSEVKKEIRLNSIRAWQRRWDRQEEARLTHAIIPRGCPETVLSCPGEQKSKSTDSPVDTVCLRSMPAECAFPPVPPPSVPVAKTLGQWNTSFSTVHSTLTTGTK